VSNTLLVLALVSAGMGGSLVLPSLAYIDMDNIVYRPLAKYGKAALWVVHRQVESDPAVIAFLAAVRGIGGAVLMGACPS